MSKISLEDFELSVARRNGEEAYRHAMSILSRIDRGFGRIDAVPMQASVDPGNEQVRLERFSTRFTAALGQLVCDEAIPLSPRATASLLLFHRWIDLLFANSGFKTAEHLLIQLGAASQGGDKLAGDRLLRFFLLFSPRAENKMDFASVLAANPHMGAIALLNYLGTRYCFTERGHAFRERLLEWLPGKLDNVMLGPIFLRNVAEPYMHCSYAQTPRKHEIKKDLMVQMRRACLEAGCQEADLSQPLPAGKPTVVVLTEHFSKGHSVFRTHSRAVRSLRESFNVVGVGGKRMSGPDVEACFDETINYAEGDFFESVRKTADEILARKPAFVFHLGVGMSDHVIALASLRLAKVQAVSFGHTATTMSPVIDYMILPRDFIGSPDVFSETLLLVPPEAMPYTPVTDLDVEAVQARAAAAKPAGVIRVAVAASIMKLNAPFFAALKVAADAAKTPVEYHFFPLAGVGLSKAHLSQCLETRLPQAIVHAEQPYETYMEALAGCDFYVCPFPYGNMNSIIDAARLGLPGVCLDGPEAHAHADVAYFARLGLPPQLAAKTVDGYSREITRLIDDTVWRDHCHDLAKASDLDAGFFTGDETLFCRAIEKMLAQA
jgi:hypothetical protein